jgi:Family of unknown function (DUF6600)
MKTFKILIAANLVLWGSLFLLIYAAKSELEVSASVQINAPADFYGPLAANGSWVDVGGYGRCFRPAAVDAGWRPYCEGTWVWTDCGWYWESDEPWAWACYHYGTWFDDPAQGWIWVPGIEWAPAWVTWRTGGSFVGWAPCAPRGATVAPAVFAFVEVNHFQDPIRREFITVNNTTAIGQTREMSGPGREKRNINGKTQDVVVNRGPDMEAIQKATGKQLKTVPIQDVSREKGVPPNLGPTDRKAEPATPKEPAGSGNDKRPPGEVKEQILPNQTPNPQSEKPVETRQPSIEQSITPPKPGEDVPERVVPSGDSGAQLQRPPENTQPIIQHQPPPTHRTPVASPRQQQRANPPREVKPSNPPQGQDKKDGLNKSPQMMAGMFCNPPLHAGLS